MVIAGLINIDKDVMSGTPVFMGTRVPITSLFEHLEDEISIHDFLTDFPTVSKEQVVGVLHLASQTFRLNASIKTFL